MSPQTPHPDNFQRSTIGYPSNSWASCYLLWETVKINIPMSQLVPSEEPSTWVAVTGSSRKISVVKRYVRTDGTVRGTIPIPSRLPSILNNGWAQLATIWLRHKATQWSSRTLVPGHLWLLASSYLRMLRALKQQESRAIAKMTARCALCMGWVPWKFSWVPDYTHGYFSKNV